MYCKKKKKEQKKRKTKDKTNINYIYLLAHIMLRALLFENIDNLTFDVGNVKIVEKGGKY